jgi:hypothetical protein
MIGYENTNYADANKKHIVLDAKIVGGKEKFHRPSAFVILTGVK